MARYVVAGWLLLSACAAAACAVAADGPNWDRFRGPNGSGLSDVRGIPTAWTSADYRWTAELPGTGNSSPVVWGDRLFVTAADEDKLERSLLCYAAADGRLLWSRIVPFVKEKKHRHNSYATGTPAVDARRVYTLWQGRRSSQLLAYDHDGKLQWTCEVGPYEVGHGGGISPVVVDGVVALNLNHEGASCLLGVDAATGVEKWRVPRDAVRATYSTPCTFTDAAGRNTLVFTSWRHGMTGVEPTTGKILWELPEIFDKADAEDKRAIGSPFTFAGLVYGNCGFVGGKKYLAAVRPGAADGSATDGRAAEAAFRLDRNVSQMTSALVDRGLLFVWADAGIVVCSRADTGKTLWTERVGGNYSSSPISIDGKIYCISDDGEVVVVAAAEEFAELGRTQLDEGTAATPAVAGDTLYLRTYSHLHALPAKR